MYSLFNDLLSILCTVVRKSHETIPIYGRKPKKYYGNARSRKFVNTNVIFFS